jgi:hypothetical protein
VAGGGAGGPAADAGLPLPPSEGLPGAAALRGGVRGPAAPAPAASPVAAGWPGCEPFMVPTADGPLLREHPAMSAPSAPCLLLLWNRCITGGALLAGVSRCSGCCCWWWWLGVRRAPASAASAGAAIPTALLSAAAAPRPGVPEPGGQGCCRGTAYKLFVSNIWALDAVVTSLLRTPAAAAPSATGSILAVLLGAR